MAWVLYLRGGNRYKEGTWPVDNKKVKPSQEWLNNLYQTVVAEVAEERERRRLEEAKKQKAEIEKAKAKLPRMTRAQLKAFEEEAAWEDVDE